jgi:hypothetical protein
LEIFDSVSSYRGEQEPLAFWLGERRLVASRDGLRNRAAGIAVR